MVVHSGIYSVWLFIVVSLVVHSALFSCSYVHGSLFGCYELKASPKIYTRIKVYILIL